MTDTIQLLRDALEAAIADAKPISKRTYWRQGEDCSELVEETIWPDWIEKAKDALAAPLPAQPQGQGAEPAQARERLAQLEQWIDATGAIVKNSSWHSELQAIVAGTGEPAQQDVIQDALNTVLWLEHRLPKGYGDVPHVKRTIAALEAASLPSPAPQAAVPSEREKQLEGMLQNAMKTLENANNTALEAIKERDALRGASPVVSDSTEWTKGQTISPNEGEHRWVAGIDISAPLHFLRHGIEVAGFSQEEAETRRDAILSARALARTAPIGAEDTSDDDWIDLEVEKPANSELVHIKLDNGQSTTGQRYEKNGFVGWVWNGDFDAKATHWKRIAASPSAAQGDGT